MDIHKKITAICYEFGKSHLDNGIINSFRECPISLSHLRDIREDSYKLKKTEDLPDLKILQIKKKKSKSL